SQIELEVAGSSPKALKVDQIPKVIQATNSEVQSLVVSFVDSSGKPVITPQDTTVFLSSSQPSVATLQSSILMPAGSSYAVIRVHSTDNPGVTTITTSASDLASADLQYTTVGYVGSISQYALGLYTVPKVASDGQEHESVFVQLQDQTNNPVPA